MERREYRKLHAEWYEYVSTSSPSWASEVAFWVRRIEAAGQSVLELGCGTGKLLIPLVERGFDIAGVDNSEDMLARCRDACHKKGLRPDLYQQSMLEMELPRKFRLIIFPSGGLSLFTEDADCRELFRRATAHLEPGGTFIYSFETIPARYPENNGNWVGNWIRGPGDIVIAWRNHCRVNAARHTWERLFVVEKYVGGRLVEAEANERVGRHFSLDETLDYARAAGLSEFVVTHEATDESPREGSTWLTVRCRKLP